MLQIPDLEVELAGHIAALQVECQKQETYRKGCSLPGYLIDPSVDYNVETHTSIENTTLLQDRILHVVSSKRKGTSTINDIKVTEHQRIKFPNV